MYKTKKKAGHFVKGPAFLCFGLSYACAMWLVLRAKAMLESGSYSGQAYGAWKWMLLPIDALWSSTTAANAKPVHIVRF
jgi:hypothetical protein